MAELEERTVLVNDPKLSDDANRRLTEAVREVLGTDHVRVPVGRTRVSEGERPHAGPLERMTAFKAAGLGSVAVTAGVAAIIATTGNHWWILAVAVVVLLIVLAAVTQTIIALASTAEYPDPSLVAYLSEQGVRDPEVRFSELVHEFTPIPESGHRRTAVEDDPALAAAEQTESVTPSGGTSDAVGPGS